MGVEPTWDRRAAPPGFADRTPHRGTILLLSRSAIEDQPRIASEMPTDLVAPRLVRQGLGMVTGGTGVTGRDGTPEAVSYLKHLAASCDRT